ncbi:MAG: hypothetical protein GOV00_01270 [Candidatus Altiarchaeota archaeon]|nr:hypothetical protein [Candidatus Altiarchaeota archaeon]
MGRSTIHYMLPVYLMFFSFFSTIVGLKISQVFTSPEMFIDSAAHAAATTIENVCADVFVEKNIPSPPVRSQYQISRCDDVAARTTVGAIWLAADVADLASSFRRGGIDDSAEATTTALNVIDSGGDATQAIKKALSASSGASDELIQNGRKLSAKGGEAGKIGDDLVDSGEEMRLILDSPMLSDDMKVIEMAQYHENVKDVLNLLETLEDANSVMKGVSFTKYLVRDGVYFSGNIINKIRVVSRAPKRAVVATRRVERPIVHATQFLIYNMDFLPLVNLALPTLEDLSMIVNVLKGPHVGVQIYPLVVSLFNISDFEAFKPFSGRAANISIKYNEYAAANRTEMISLLKNLRYYSSANTVNSLKNEDIFPLRRGDYVSRDLVYNLFIDFEEQVETYKDSGSLSVEEANTLLEASDDLRFEIINTSSDFEMIREEVGSWSVNGLTGGLLALMGSLQEISDGLEDIAMEWETFQKEVGQHVVGEGDCNAIDLLSRAPELSEHYSTLKVADCGVVFDCYPESQCIVGLPVVEANPWIPYLPVDVLDASEIAEVSTLIGFSYGADTKTMSTGFLNTCMGKTKVLVCAKTGVFKSCRVVDCGKELNIEWEYNPTIKVSSSEDGDGNPTVTVKGNFLEW